MGTVENRRAWTIAASLFVALFFLWGGGYNTGPIFLAALLKAFNWSHARVGSIIGGLSLAVGISAPIAGWLLDRIEARWVMGSGAIIAVLGLLGASSSHTFGTLLASVILIGIGLGAATWLAASLVIVNWFPGPPGDGARPGNFWNGIWRHGDDADSRQHDRSLWLAGRLLRSRSPCCLARHSLAAFCGAHTASQHAFAFRCSPG